MRKIVTLMATGAIVFGLTACGKEGPAQTAGKQIDQAVENLKQKTQDITKEGGEFDKAKAKIQKALEDTQTKIRSMTESKPATPSTGTGASTTTPAAPTGQ